MKNYIKLKKRKNEKLYKIIKKEKMRNYIKL